MLNPWNLSYSRYPTLYLFRYTASWFKTDQHLCLHNERPAIPEKENSNKKVEKVMGDLDEIVQDYG